MALPALRGPPMEGVPPVPAQTTSLDRARGTPETRDPSPHCPHYVCVCVRVDPNLWETLSLNFWGWEPTTKDMHPPQEACPP